MYRYPVNYIAITQYFGKNHKGLDLGWNSKHGGKNQPIYAAADGVVYSTKDKDKTGKSWGNYVKIKHSNSTYTLYAHLKDGIKVKKGQKVKQGDLLGYMGNTGDSNGNHLHFECYKGGASTSYRVDPLKLTYVYPGQAISSNKDAIKGLKYYKPKEEKKDIADEKKDTSNELTKLKAENEELKAKYNDLEIKNKELINYINQYKSIYKCPQNGLYKINIELKENEELYIVQMK